MKKIKNIYIGNTPYNLLLFFLINKYNKENTLLFSINNLVDDNIPNTLRLYSSNNKILDILKNMWIFFNIKKKYNLKKVEYYVQDHILFSYKFLGDKKYILIEDGTSSYTKIKEENKKSKIKKFLGILEPYGVSSQCKKIYLREILPIPEKIKNKVEKIDIFELWKYKSLSEKKEINNLFNLSNEEIKKLKNKKIILFTQPISEDGYVSEQEKIDIYKQILSQYKNKEKIVLKIHPREKTDYSLYFPEISILKSKIPIELYMLNGAEFDKAITIFSTAIYNFFNTKTKIVFLGSKIHPILEKEFPKHRELNFHKLIMK